MTHKRVNGTGSVVRRRDGRWVATVTRHGNRVYRYATTRKEAELKLARLLAEVDVVGSPAPPPTTTPAPEPLPTLAEWVEDWLIRCAKTRRPGTCDTYRRVLSRVLPQLENIRLDDLTPERLSRIFATLEDGSRVIQNSYVVLKTCLGDAVRSGLLGLNPLRDVPKPAWRPQARRYWTVAETRRFLEAALSSLHSHAPLFAFLATTGLRISEALALTWADVDRSRGTVVITKSLIHVAGVWHELPPKTKAARREVSLPDAAVEALCLLPQTRHRVFFDGEPPMWWQLRNALRSLCRESAVPYVNVHGLRHVAATLALKATHDAHAVRRRLGHSHISTTIGIYGYALEDDDSVAGAVDRLLAAG